MTEGSTRGCYVHACRTGRAAGVSRGGGPTARRRDGATTPPNTPPTAAPGHSRGARGCGAQVRLLRNARHMAREELPVGPRTSPARGPAPTNKWQPVVELWPPPLLVAPQVVIQRPRLLASSTTAHNGLRAKWFTFEQGPPQDVPVEGYIRTGDRLAGPPVKVREQGRKTAASGGGDCEPRSVAADRPALRSDNLAHRPGRCWGPQSALCPPSHPSQLRQRASGRRRRRAEWNEAAAWFDPLQRSCGDHGCEFFHRNRVAVLVRQGSNRLGAMELLFEGGKEVGIDLRLL